MDVFLNLKFLSLIQNTCIIISNQFPGIQCSKIFYIVLYIGMKELTWYVCFDYSLCVLITVCVWIKCFETKTITLIFHWSTGLTPPIQPHISSSFYLLTTYTFHPKGHSQSISPMTLKKCTQVTPLSRPLILLSSCVCGENERVQHHNRFVWSMPGSSEEDC